MKPTKPIVIGIDPDSSKHGVAIYESGVLMTLSLVETLDLYLMVERYSSDLPVVIGLEDVKSQSFVYARNSKSSKAEHAKVALSVGRCQQAQVELERMLSRLPVTIRKFKPQRGNWANNAEQFKKVTGWTGRSNPDTRSASYFGFLALN